MGLVDYASDSDSGSDTGPASGSAAAQPAQRIPKQSQPSSKKPFRKVVDRSNPGKIVVSLPTPAPSANDTADRDGEGPPAKRARTAGGGGLFSGFNSFLPAPKNNGRQPAVASLASGSATRPGVNLKTSAAPGFSRDGGEDDVFPQHAAATSTTESPDHTPRGLNLPAPKRQEAAAPSIPEGQIPAEQVKLVGKPLMFRPLSVGLNTKKKKNNKLGSHATAAPQRAQNSILSSSASSTPTHDASVAAPKKKVSLFSMHAPEPTDDAAAAYNSPHNKLDDAYEPLFTAAHEAEPSSAAESWETAADAQRSALMNQATMTTGPTQSLDHMADDLNLSAAARRELFGRDGSNFAAKTVVNFNMDKEYQHNEDVRASGDQQMHHPVRAIQSGKHSLKQLVQNVQNQKDALEDSFAKGRSNRKEASSRYGW
ncbi:hypothetical protein E4U57_005681 [Claviceps arundinis]|uniref:Stress activated map kinase interacting n=1 Tax=Claviceps arundinis TaxID=1623583 RepID=A0ABQ7P2X9_9HYPO|nr:hypothetical protein E4U57_005681 [Claviceps arundinis]